VGPDGPAGHSGFSPETLDSHAVVLSGGHAGIPARPRVLAAAIRRPVTPTYARASKTVAFEQLAAVRDVAP